MDILPSTQPHPAKGAAAPDQRPEGSGSASPNGVDAWWRSGVVTAIGAEIQASRSFTVESLRARYPLDEPMAPAHWGVVFRALRRQGLIDAVTWTEARRPERKGGALRVWQGTATAHSRGVR